MEKYSIFHNKLNMLQKSSLNTTVSGLNLWNSLPNHIKECTSLSSFKQSLYYNHMVTKPQF